nr:putative ankyrin repeat protein [Pithovirus mammoth]
MEVTVYSPFTDLPFDVLEIILRSCEGYAYINSQVCSEWREMVLPWGNLKEKFIDVCFEEDLPYVAKFPASYFTNLRLHLLVRNERVDLLQMAVNRGVYVFSCQTPAAKLGSVKVLKWYDSEICKISPNHIGYLAAKEGHWEVLQWLIEKESQLDSSVMAGAAEFGDLEIVQRLKAYGCQWDETACDGAAEKGHLEILKWLRSNPEDLCPWNERASRVAAQGGDLETLKWMKEQNCPWHSEVALVLADNEHFETLKWELENGGIWNDRIYDAIIRKGDLEVLQWIRGKGYLWDGSVVDSAAFYGQLHILKWVTANGLQLTSGCVDSACQSQDLDTLKWLIRQGQTWPNYSRYFMLKVNVQIKEWALDNGCPTSYFSQEFGI